MTVRLIATDLDGTLLDGAVVDGSGTVTARTRQALDAAPQPRHQR